MSDNILTQIDEILLCNFEENYDISQQSEYIQYLWNGNWKKLLDDEIINDILQESDNEKEIINKLKSINKDKQEDIFCIGIASLFLFIQNNFLGPESSVNVTKCITIENCKQFLSCYNEEEIDVNIQNIELLFITKCVFENCSLNNSNVSTWWCLRYIIVYQSLLDECSEVLYTKVKDKLIVLNDWNINNRLKAKLYLEIAQFYLLYGQINETEKHLNIVKELLGINFELSGELGKRTKFQEKEVAQIVLKVTLDENIIRPTFETSNVPDIVKLDDEVRLDEIQYCHQQNMIPFLPIVEQTLILSTVQFMQKSKPKDDLLSEESGAYISALLSQNNIWTVRFSCLLLRCLLEQKHKRTIERSLNQCETLISNIDAEFPKVTDRLKSFWGCKLEPKWKVKGHLANLTLNLGLVKAALDLFLKLHMWEEVIICYTIMNLRHKAAEIIQTQLKSKPTVKLWCLLGDATDDVSCFEKAWELSGKTSSRAQRHWGQYLFAKKQYKECIPFLQKSLEINSLQNMVWLRLGYAALETEDWKLAATCYRRYTYLEPGGFEAWNNLAKAYIKLNEKSRAHFALQEALKFSFDNWKIWDNFMVVSAATKQFSDVLRSYHQILDLKQKHLDIEVLLLLTQELSTQKQERLLSKARELFGRLTSIYPNESQVWAMYADLAPNLNVKAQRLNRAYRGLVQNDWSKNPVQSKQVLDVCEELGKVTLETEDAAILSSTRLILKSVLSAAKKQNWEENEERVHNLEDILEKIVNLSLK